MYFSFFLDCLKSIESISIESLLTNLFSPLSRNGYSLCHRTLVVDAGAKYPAFGMICRIDYSSILVAEAFPGPPADPGRTPDTRRTSADDASSCRAECTLCRSRRNGTADIWRSSGPRWPPRCSGSASRKVDSWADREMVPRRLPVYRHCSSPRRTARSRLERHVGPLKSGDTRLCKTIGKRAAHSNMHSIINYLLISVSIIVG